MACNAPLAPGQYWGFCGETDMGQTMPALCSRCGGTYTRADAGLLPPEAPEHPVRMHCATVPVRQTKPSPTHWAQPPAANYTTWLVKQPTIIQEGILGVDRAANLRAAYEQVLRIANGTAPTEEVSRCIECQRPWDSHAETCSRPVPF